MQVQYKKNQNLESMKIVVRKHVKEYSENKNIYKTRKTTKILASIIYKIDPFFLFEKKSEITNITDIIL